MAVYSLAALLALSLVGPDPSSVAPTKEFRRHFVAFTKQGAALYQVTVITRLRDDEDRHFVLITDSGGTIFS